MAKTQTGDLLQNDDSAEIFWEDIKQPYIWNGEPQITILISCGSILISKSVLPSCHFVVVTTCVLIFPKII